MRPLVKIVPKIFPTFSHLIDYFTVSRITTVTPPSPLNASEFKYGIAGELLHTYVVVNNAHHILGSWITEGL